MRRPFDIMYHTHIVVFHIFGNGVDISRRTHRLTLTSHLLQCFLIIEAPDKIEQSIPTLENLELLSVLFDLDYHLLVPF